MVNFDRQTDQGYAADYYRMTGNVYKKGIRSVVARCFHHNLRFAFWYRKYQKTGSFLGRFILYRLSRKYGLEISPQAKIGSGLYLGHPYNITVGEGVILGDNVNLHKGYTIGRTNRGNAGSPTIGNNVFIGINATVVGDIRIGDNVLIAPNSYVNFDVPEHSIVIGNPGEIHYKEDATKGYVGFCL